MLSLILLCAALGADAPAESLTYLVAHRGAVTDEAPENSLAALEEAIRRGYTHVEVDIRRTQDGRLVCFHDRGLHRAAGVKAFVDKMSYEDFRAALSEERAPTLETFCEAAAGRMELMPDVKELPDDATATAAAAEILRILQEHDVLEEAVFIGDPRVKEAVRAKARVSISPLTPREKMEEIIAQHGKTAYFAFGHARDFDKERVALFDELGVPCIVSINTFHYPGGDSTAQGLADVQRMLELGVDGLQIDAVYDAAPALAGRADGE